ncbi:uncharacterized protein F5Z01DRAFT_314407 [Emericellopsis atlantica]|uniref:Glutathione synthetase n=1 Tax=Emericellopsis atlantica TaxID=2614577 RepID=A0A9P7ZUN3_9HYPO|nr:uncharacterized protein F5Z01DRAFT_314407 [Emericellopsis atlantica]KAG9258020.1 hypothetical protein F5Z01DRAFT_314407 [Emericellopsis atlantica]
MSSLTSGVYPPPLSSPEQTHLITTIKDWTIANGLTIRPPPNPKADPNAVTAVSAPVTLFPSPFPRVCFEQGRVVQQSYNELYAAVSRDEKFIEDMVNEVKDGDDFIGQLWNIHLKVKEEGYTQPLSLGLFRSDYMVHQDCTSEPPTLQAKQVEFNTIASSFGGLSQQTSGLHKFLANTEYPLLEKNISSILLDLPENKTTQGLAAGIQAAYTAYGDSELGHPRCVVFLTQDGERNVFDQRHLEYQVLQAKPAIPVFRLPFSEVLQHTSIADTPKRQLLYKLPRNPDKVYEVAVIYLRAGYGPGDYPDSKGWEARLHLERSHAIRCPTVLTQLAGTKKVQQVLATPDLSVLAKYINNKTPAAQELWKTFTNIYPMDTSPSGLEARKKALDPQEAEKYVLKPQREGGGNNIYRGSIPSFLKTVPEEHWGSYILMELITPPPVTNTILRNGALEAGGVICELGVYGTCLWDQNSGKAKHNEQAGYLLRTKGDKSEEGGVAAGYGCMDSVALV